MFIADQIISLAFDQKWKVMTIKDMTQMIGLVI
jgi:hypothetical protein